MRFRFEKYVLLSAIALALVSAGCRKEPALLTTATPARSIVDYAVSPQGSIALLDGAYGGYEQQLVFIGQNGEPQKIEAKINKEPLNRIGFTPDGRWLIGSNRWGLWIGKVEGDTIKSPVFTGNRDDMLQERSIMSPPYYVEDGVIRVVSVAYPRSLKITRWKMSDAGFLGEQTFVLSPKATEKIVRCAFSPDGTKAVIVWVQDKQNPMISGAKFGRVEVRDTSNGRLLKEMEPITPRGLSTPAFSWDAKYVAAADSMGIGYIWNTHTGELIQTFSGMRHQIKNGHNGYYDVYSSNFIQGPATLVFAPDNRTVIAAINDGYVTAYDIESGLPVKVLAKRPDFVRIMISPDRRSLLFLENGQALYSLPLPKFPEPSYQSYKLTTYSRKQNTGNLRCR